MNQAQKSRASPCCSMVKRLLLLLITACMNSWGLTYAPQINTNMSTIITIIMIIITMIINK